MTDFDYELALERAGTIGKLKEQLASKDKRIKELEDELASEKCCLGTTYGCLSLCEEERDKAHEKIADLKSQLSKANIDWANTEAEKNDLNAQLKHEQGKRAVGINQVLIDENKNLKAKIAKVLNATCACGCPCCVTTRKALKEDD